MINKWVRPAPREKARRDVSDHETTSIKKGISFHTIKKQVGKKSISTKSRGDRVLSKFSDGND